MAKRLTGRNPLAYCGDEPVAPPQTVKSRRDPTTEDYRNFNLHTLWINTVNDDAFILVRKENNVATWRRFSGGAGGNILSLTTDDSNVVLPDGVGNIDLVGAHGLNTSGAVANEASIQINNTITLGDLSVVTTGNDSLTLTSGDITLSGTGANAGGNINMPNTGGTTPGDIGVINWGGSRFIHNSGTNNTYLGENAGSLAGGSNLSVGIGYQSLLVATTTSNTAIGAHALETKTATGGFNVAIGSFALQDATTGANLTVIGHAACMDLTTGTENCVVGTNAMTEATSASRNLALGTGRDAGLADEKGPLFQLATGNNNIAIGCGTSAFLTGPGFNYTGAESNNILIGGATTGTLGESNVMRLGTTGAGEGQVNRCFIAGVRGVTTGVADAVAVLVDSADQFGTISSSIRVKKNIEDMGTATGSLFDLRPVLFDYIESPSARRQYGLIAEEVEKVIPDLVVYDKNGDPESVRYHELPVMLLNEMKKMAEQIKELEKKLGEKR